MKTKIMSPDCTLSFLSSIELSSSSPSSARHLKLENIAHLTTWLRRGLDKGPQIKDAKGNPSARGSRLAINKHISSQITGHPESFNFEDLQK